jgi:ABC-type glycerol-3-phosphate transport system permease component
MIDRTAIGGAQTEAARPRVVTPAHARTRGLDLSRLAVPLRYAVLFLVAIIAAFPFYWMLVGSFSPLADLFSVPPPIVPVHPTANNYAELFQRIPFARNALNSFIISLLAGAIGVLLATMAGFAFAKYKFPGREILFYGMIATMVLPEEALVVPLFVLMSQIGWVDTYQGAVIPSLASAFGIFWMRQYMAGIPDEMLEAARIDGASDFQIYYLIVLPVLGPGLAALAMILFMRAWNMFLWPLIVLRTEDMYTIPLSLARLIGLTEQPYHLVLAGSVLATLPLVIVFVLLQRQFIAGVMAGSVKS